MMEARCFEVGVRGTDWTRSVLALSAGRAKSDYWRDVVECWPGVKYTDITCRLGVRRVDEAFNRVAAYRGVPFAHVGMAVEVDGHHGVIAGKNDSANFDVLFTDGEWKGATLNCHPNWKVKYFDRDGALVKEFRG